MSRVEYKVVPAPSKGIKVKGLKTPEARFAHAMETALNEHAAEGWVYVRADTLPAEERSGLTSKTTVFRNVLVFERLVDEWDEAETEDEPVAAIADLREEPETPAEEEAADESGEEATEPAAEETGATERS